MDILSPAIEQFGLPPGFAEQAMAGNPMKPEDPKSHIDRDPEEADAARKALVKFWIDEITRAKKFHKKAYDCMRDDQAFVGGDQWPEMQRDKYIANIAQRHIQQRVSALYAKNPTAVCRRRETLDFAIWDESQETLKLTQIQMQQAVMTGQMIPPEANAMLMDIKQGTDKRKLMDRISRSLEIVFKHELDEQMPPAKLQMKGLVRRTLVNSVGFVKLGYQRLFDKRPDDVVKVGDLTEQIKALERLSADQVDGEVEANSAEAERLGLMLRELTEADDVIVREGMVLDFPDSDSIIIDPKCTRMSGFLGAQWVAQEFILDTDDIKEIYSVDLQKGDFTSYEQKNGDKPKPEDEKGNKSRTCVWEIYCKKDGLVYVVCDGGKDFLQEPDEPKVRLERFWPWFPLTFNELEDKKRIYPISDVSLIRPMQQDYNQNRQALREHRRANRPKSIVARGALDDDDLAALKSHPGNCVLQLNGLSAGQKIEEVIQPMKQTGMDPGLYEVDSTFTDLERVVGTSAENLGGSSNSTATSSSIAESSRASAMASNVDDLDDLLTEVCRAAGAMLLMEMSEESVKKIVGAGAVWPEISANEVAQSLMLEIEAGSSGRPNKAAEMDNFTKIMPFLIQIPGIDPAWLAKQAIQRMDDRLNVTDALMGAMQSIVAQNAQKQLAAADPSASPNAQGPSGANNGPQAPATPAPAAMGGPGM